MKINIYALLKSVIKTLSMSYLFWAILLFAPQVSANNWWLSWVEYIERTSWWANEDMRYATRPEYKKILQAQFADDDTESPSEKQRTTAMDYLAAFFAQEIKIDRVFRKEAWKVLFWPLQYVKQKTKLLVHHTATSGTLPKTIEEEKKYMKDLYAYHAFSNWWWDIGYNFVVMPSGRIYEWRKWGAWVIWAHVSWNNTKSVGVSLVGNFENIIPPQSQVDSLTTILTALAKKYDINPLEQKYYFKKSSKIPFIVAEKHEAIAWHTDAWYTACPWENLYVLLPAIRNEIVSRIAWNTPQQIAVTSSSTSTVSSLPYTNTDTSSSEIDTLKQIYVQQKWFTTSAAKITRLEKAPLFKNITTIQNTLVRVLLYEASLRDDWNISCDPTCVVRINGLLKRTTSLVVVKNKQEFTAAFGGKKYTASKFAISAGDNGTVSITNYDRLASNKQPLNIFRQSLLFAYAPMKKIDSEPANTHQIINILSLDNYMKWIAEASDQETQTKANVLALLSKGYALFYMWWWAKHPSIPTNALYNAIDDPRLFQKYLGKWWESISQKRPVALEQTKGTYITYNWVLPILPYFHCSAWFTRSAKEKRWWQDTPYLQSVKDTVTCDDFAWHGVGLSGKWAAQMAEQGKTEKEIIQYYYKWVELSKK